jgi:hypothetical protein
MITATQAAILSIVRRAGPLTIIQVMDRTGYCHATVRRVLRDPQFAVVGRAWGGSYLYNLAERANQPPEERPNPIVEQMLSDQAVWAKAIRAVANKGHRQAAIELAKLWLAEDSALKRALGGGA